MGSVILFSHSISTFEGEVDRRHVSIVEYPKPLLFLYQTNRLDTIKPRIKPFALDVSQSGTELAQALLGL